MNPSLASHDREVAMTYTKEEIVLLKNIIGWRTYANSMCALWIKVYENSLKIYEHDLYDSINGHTQPIWGFLHATPLEEVPLYVNDIPELARWRLMIAR